MTQTAPRLRTSALEPSAQEKQYEEQKKQQEEELADEDSSAQREYQNDDEKQNEHPGSNRSADGAEPYTAKGFWRDGFPWASVGRAGTPDVVPPPRRRRLADRALA